MVMAFPLPKPPPISTHRFSLKCLHVQSDQLHKSTSCFPVCPQICKYNFNLYVDPQRVTVRCFATVRSLETGDMQDHVSPNASALQSFQRSKTLGEHSSTPFHSMSNFETDLQELFGKVKALIMEGNRKDASDLLRANCEAVKEQLDAGARGVEEAALLDVISLGYLAVGNIKLVKSLLEMRLRTCQQYIDQLGISQQTLIINSSKYHKRYTLPVGEAMPEAIPAQSNYHQGCRLNDEDNCYNFGNEKRTLPPHQFPTLRSLSLSRPNTRISSIRTTPSSSSVARWYTSGSPKPVSTCLHKRQPDGTEQVTDSRFFSHAVNPRKMAHGMHI